MNPRSARAGAALGALGATALAVGAHTAQAADGLRSPLLVSDVASLRDRPALPLSPSGSPLAFSLLRQFSVGRHHGERTASLIARMIAAGNRIARLPYVFGGGHGSFSASGYDCSGSVSYVLHAAGLLSVPADSSGLEGFGDPGPGRHVTVYANAGHAWMTIDGRRFDTIAFQETGTRWSSSISSGSGYVIRHPRGM